MFYYCTLILKKFWIFFVLLMQNLLLLMLEPCRAYFKRCAYTCWQPSGDLLIYLGYTLVHLSCLTISVLFSVTFLWKVLFIFINNSQSLRSMSGSYINVARVLPDYYCLVMWWLPLVEQDMLTLPENLSLYLCWSINASAFVSVCKVFLQFLYVFVFYSVWCIM